MILPLDFKEFLQFLRSERVRYLLVGGWAVAAHGHPRTTNDIDIWVASDRDNAESLGKALVRFGFSNQAVVPADLLIPHRVLRIGVPPLRIDILTSVSGLDFDECDASKVVVEIDGILIDVISRGDLIKNKQAAGRHKDLADVDALEGH